MSRNTFRCYAHKDGDQWQAICIDLDIAVEGHDFREVYDLLNGAIYSYILDAAKEPERIRDQLMARRAPFWVRLKLAAGHVLELLSSRTHEAEATFSVPCPA